MRLVGSSSDVEPGAAGESPAAQRVNPFAANNIQDPRFIWDPSAHRYFGEECSFFFIRFRETHGTPDLDAIRRVDEWLNQLQIRSKYVYKLFGYYDAMVRIWALPSRLSSFRNLLRTSAQEIPAVKEFSVTHTRLVLDTDRIVDDAADDYRRIQSSLQQIKQLVSCDRGIIEEEQKRALQTLEASGLIHPVVAQLPTNERTSSSFRFATVIKIDDLQGMRVSLIQLLQLVAEYNHKNAASNSGMIRCALYQGSGFGDFLASGLISDHDSLVRFSSDLTLRLQELGVRCRTETHITAGSESIECDVVDPTQEDTTPAEERMLDFLASQQVSVDRLREAVNALTADSRALLANTFRRYEFDFVSSDFGHYFRDFLLAQALGDQRHLQRALMCLIELEGLLANLWLNECARRNAFKAVVDAARLVGLEKVDIKKLSLKQMIDITGSLMKGPGDWLLEILQLNWRQVLKDLTDVRNDVAHGRLFVDSEYLSNNWGALANRLGETGSLYNQVRRLLTDGAETTKANSNGPNSLGHYR